MARMSPAERQQAYRERQKIRMAEDPEYAVEVRLKRAASDKAYREQLDPDVRRDRWNNWYRAKYGAEPRKPADPSDPTRAKYHLAWARANKDKRCESTRRRKALLRGATGVEQFTKAHIWVRDLGVCGICLEPADPSEWHLDHVIPVSKGGAHTMDNVQVSHPKCNLSKSNKILTGGEST